MQTMQISGYLDLIDKISSSGLVCRCCGAAAETFSDERETFCNFCESHVSYSDANILNSNSENESNLINLQKSAATGEWIKGVKYADALALTKDPFFLYGASMYYRLFSDFTYNDVNYEQGGFMYSNAEKRSDDFQKNKYNAMALISKSKEYLFKIIKTVSSSQQPDSEHLYLKFISNIKLKRYPQAAESLVELETASPKSTVSKYAALVFSVDVVYNDKPSNKPLQIDSASGSSTFFYYLAKQMVNQRNLEDAITILNRLNSKSYMPMAFYYRKRVVDVNLASGL